MAIIYGTDNQYNVPTALEITFNGEATDWGMSRLFTVEKFSNSAESVDGKYKISDFSCDLVDTDGAIWGSLGSNPFGKSWSVVARVGGTMGYTTDGLSNTGLEYSHGSAQSFIIHQGKITEVAKRNRLVHIKSQNNLKQLSDLRFTPPWLTSSQSFTKLGSFYFKPLNLATSYPNMVYNASDDGLSWEMEGAIFTVAVADIEVSYPRDTSRGSFGIEPGYSYVGTQFYDENIVLRFEGSYLGVRTSGTINETEEAHRHGFSSLADAEAAKTGGSYVINKTRLSVRRGTAAGGEHLIFKQTMRLGETPANLFRQLIGGACVYPYFTFDDIESTSFAESQRITTYQYFEQEIKPEDEKVVTHIKDIIGATGALFSVNSTNKFEFRCYGPRPLTSTIDTITQGDIKECEQTNIVDDYFNHIIVKYAWDGKSRTYGKTYEAKSSNWTIAKDKPLEIESKWLQNDNEVALMADRLLRKVEATVPKIRFTTSLKYVGMDLGSLVSITDTDSGLSAKKIQLTGFTKAFLDGRDVEFEAVDGEFLYQRRGFGFWDDGTSLPGQTVDNNSTLGWGVSGTVANINESLYGTQFSWW